MKSIKKWGFLLRCFPVIVEVMWSFEVRMIIPERWECEFCVPSLLFSLLSLRVLIYICFLLLQHTCFGFKHDFTSSLCIFTIFVPAFCFSQSLITFPFIIVLSCIPFLFSILLQKALHNVLTIMWKHGALGFCWETSCLWTPFALIYQYIEMCLIFVPWSRVRDLILYLPK